MNADYFIRVTCPAPALTQFRGGRGPVVRLRVERLEPRLLMTQRNEGEQVWQLSHGGLCGCTTCAGLAQAGLPAEVATGSTTGAIYPLDSLPQLNSLPGAQALLFLDFDGYRADRWGSYSDVTAGVFDRDGDPATFSDLELQSIREIWSRTAEDYSPFQINVTTVDPGYEAERTTARIVIGGHWRDWFGESAGGIAYTGGFFNSSPNVGFAFEDALGNGNPRFVAEAVSHEAGHLFGLQHQSLWSNGTLANNYSTGSSLWAPLMGIGYYAQRTTWALGATSQGASVEQDDMELLARGSSRLGYRPDEAGNSPGSAVLLTPQPTTASFLTRGLIGRTADEDWYAFQAGTGPLTLDLQVASYGANLDAVLELRNAAGRSISTSAPGDRLGASLQANVAAGFYYAVVKGGPDYGNTGSYTLQGTVVASERSAPTPPATRITPPNNAQGELDLFVGNAGLPADPAVDFGLTNAGRSVDRVISIRNTGQGTLYLEPLDATNLPASFKLINDLPSRQLAPGRTASFRIRLQTASVGKVTGQIRLVSSDADEGQQIIRLEGTVAPNPIVVEDSDPGFQTTGVWNPLRTGRGRSTLVAVNGSGETAAQWTVPGLIPGQYHVYATWPSSPMLATDAPFTLMDGPRVIATTRVNQERAPEGPAAVGSLWTKLDTVNLTGNQLIVRLENRADDRVAADAIRVVWAGPAAETGILEKSASASPSLDAAVQRIAAALVGPDNSASVGQEPFPTSARESTPVGSGADTETSRRDLNTASRPADRISDVSIDSVESRTWRQTKTAAAVTDEAIVDPLDWLPLLAETQPPLGPPA